MKISAALQYFVNNPAESYDVSAFQEACGIGVLVTPDQIEAEVTEHTGPSVSSYDSLMDE